MAKEKESAAYARAIFEAALKELAATNDPRLQREVIAELGHLAQKGEEKTAHVTSAVALTEREKATLGDWLRRRFGDDLEVKYNLDASILGGVVVRVGDKVIDGSVAGKLAALKEKLVAGR